MLGHWIDLKSLEGDGLRQTREAMVHAGYGQRWVGEHQICDAIFEAPTAKLSPEARQALRSFGTPNAASWRHGVFWLRYYVVELLFDRDMRY